MKTRTLLLFLIVAAALVTASAAAHSDARATVVSGLMSGGEYVLTIPSPVLTPPTGYRLADAATSISQRAVIGTGGDYQLLASNQPDCRRQRLLLSLLSAAHKKEVAYCNRCQITPQCPLEASGGHCISLTAPRHRGNKYT